MPRDPTDNGSNDLSQNSTGGGHDVHVPISTQRTELSSTKDAASPAGTATVGKKTEDEDDERELKPDFVDDDE